MTGGTEFATADDVTYDRLRQKTKTVATGTYINSITDTYAGQAVQLLDSSSNFINKKIYNRIHDNSAWYPKQTSTGSLEINAEESQTGTVASNSNTSSSVIRRYRFFTMPSTYAFYIITGIECYVQSGTGKIAMGVDAIDSNPPVQTCKPLLALGQLVTISGTGLHRTSNMFSRLIRAGTLVGAWAAHETTGSIRCDATDQTYTNNTATFPSTPDYAEDSGWQLLNSSGLHPIYLTIYYRGYS